MKEQREEVEKLRKNENFGGCRRAIANARLGPHGSTAQRLSRPSTPTETTNARPSRGKKKKNHSSILFPLGSKFFV